MFGVSGLGSEQILVRAERKYSEGISALEEQTSAEAVALKLSMHSNRAMFKLQMKDFTGAVADCEVILSNPSQKAEQTKTSVYKKALFRRAQGYQWLGGKAQLQRAATDLGELVALEPSNKPAVTALKQVQELLSATQAAVAVATPMETQQAATPPAPPAPISVQTTTTTTTPSTTSPKKSPKKSPTKKLDPVAVAARAREKAKAKGGLKVPALPKTGYEFERVWRSLSSDPEAFCAYLQLIKPSMYKKLFKQGIEADLTAGIIGNVRDCMLAADHAHSLKTLSGMIKIARFETIVRFFGSKEKSDLSEIFSQLEAGGADAEKVATTKEKYGL